MNPLRPVYRSAFRCDLSLIAADALHGARRIGPTADLRLAAQSTSREAIMLYRMGELGIMFPHSRHKNPRFGGAEEFLLLPSRKKLVLVEVARRECADLRNRHAQSRY